MKTCTQCNHQYDEHDVNIPSPIPDKTCAECGTVLSDTEIQAIIDMRKGQKDESN